MARFDACFLGLLLLVLLPIQAAQKPEKLEKTERVEKVPRVVSLLPSLTEVVCALGACDRLVGVDRYSNWPLAVQKLPQLGGGLDPQIEAVFALRPDWVLMAASSPAVPRLRALGLKVLTLEPRNHQELQQSIERVAQVLALAPGRAQRLLRQIEQEVQQVAAQVPLGVKGRKVYFEIGAAPYAASESSFIGELLHRMGLVNIVPARMGPFPSINPEWVVRHPPDILMLTNADIGLNQMRARPGWSQTPGLRAALQRACVFNAGEADVLLRPGPRWGEAAVLVLRCLRAQEFSD